MFLNYISKNTNITTKQFEQITELIKERPKILSSADLLKINRSMSYMTFILKEIYEYITAKLSDGTALFSLREAKREINELNERINKLKSL